MEKDFKKRVLYEGAPSLPLVLPSYCSFDNETQKLTVNKSDGDSLKLIPETLKLLEKISKPVAVVSICGPYRSGKSYFLTRLLNNEKTSQLDHKVEEPSQLDHSKEEPSQLEHKEEPSQLDGGKKEPSEMNRAIEETFQLGHSMDACTRGVWMASSVLECDDFVVVMLDTEGIDAATSSGSSVLTDMLAFTLLVSSTLVYNSSNVPKKRDLNQMR